MAYPPNPDLTLETRVDEQGIITYPLIGAIEIGGLSILTAERRIAGALQSGGYLKRPQVSILLLQNRANQVSVLGHVNRPGRYPMETSATRVSEMLAVAGGVAPIGADVIILSGTRNGLPFRKEIDIASIFIDFNPKDNIVVAGGDEIYVPRAPTFYIYGEVQRPGSYRIERGMTFWQALATGGGPTVRGTDRNLRVRRRGADGTPETVTVDPNDLVRPDDVLYVRESIF
jgi:polysaccharide export outer membrane protein